MNSKVGLIISLIIFSFSSYSQNVDDIIKKHIEAHGGAKNWESVQSMKLSGKFTGFSIEKDFVSYKTRSGIYYSEYYLGMHPITEAFNGEKGWTIDPWQEIDFPRFVNKAEINVFKQKSEFCTPFLNYKEQGSTVEFIGKENVEGVDVFVLKLIRADGFIETWYLNAESYLEYKCESPWVDFAYPNNSEVYFDDFRTVQGVVLPFYTDRSFGSRNRIYEIENIEFNVDFDERLLEMPRSKEIKKLNFLAGKWAVNVNVMTRKGTWYAIDSTYSEILFTSTNLLEERISYERMFPINKSISYSYNSTSKKYRLAVYNDFISAIEIFEGDFVGDDLVLDNLSFGNDAETNSTYEQYTFSNITTAGFLLEVKRSSDKGITWTARDKFSYMRIME